jgi:hypothetical protein
VLADAFTIISYDRRGIGRSRRPSGWAMTSPEEQADDAAGLLDALGVAPAGQQVSGYASERLHPRSSTEGSSRCARLCRLRRTYVGAC